MTAIATVATLAIIIARAEAAARFLGMASMAVQKPLERDEHPSRGAVATLDNRMTRLQAILDELVARMDSDHTPSCINHTLNAIGWWVEHPWACTACKGVGGEEDVDTSVNCSEFTPCEHCLARGTCPRCRKPILGFGDQRTGVPFDLERDVMEHLDDLICACCSWAMGRKVGDVAPLTLDCDCWEQRIPLPEVEPVAYTTADMERELEGVDAWQEDEWRERTMRLAMGKSRF